MSRKKIILFLFLIVIFGFIIRLNLFQIPFERDEGGYAYQAWLMLTGKGVPYKDAFENKPPAVLFIYALFISVLGESPAAVRIGTYVYSIFTVVGVYLLGRKLFDERVGIVAGLVFVVYSTAQSFFGFSSNTEVFMILPIVLATLLAVIACEKEKLWLFIGAGFFCGCALMFKQVAATNILFIALYVLYRHLKLKEKRVHKLLVRYLLLFVSFLVPIILFGIYLYCKDALIDAYRFAYLFNVQNVGFRPPIKSIIRGALTPIVIRRFGEGGPVTLNSFALYWVFVVWAFVRMVWRKERGLFFLFAFLAFSFAGMFFNFYFRPHYFIQIVPAASLLAGWGIVDLYRAFKDKGMLKNFLAKAAFAALIALILISPVLMELDYYVLNSARANVAAIYSGNPFVEALYIADYLRERSSPDDTVLILGSEAEILYYAGRLSAIRFIMMYNVVGNYRHAFEYQKEIKEAVSKKPPSYAVFFKTKLSWLYDDEKSQDFFKWINSYLKEEFELAGVFVKEDPEMPTSFKMIFGKGLAGLPEEITRKSYIWIYRRKEQK